MTVLLDGKRVRDVISACVEKGMVVVYARDDRGKFRQNKDGTLEIKTLKGNVQIVSNPATPVDEVR